MSARQEQPQAAASRAGAPVVGAAVALEDVSRSFGAVRAVDSVSLSIAPGEFFTLLGPSGSGKTTLLHLLAGFQQPDRGAIRLDGAVISGLPPFRRGIGVVFQSYALFPHLSVFENVAFPLRVRRRPRAEIATRVGEALALVQLADYGARRIAQLSGGQQQRVALARAVVFKPRLLLMDEPLSALDAKLRKAMQAELKALQQQLGVTVIYVTHDQEEALALSDRVAVMQGGRVEQVAPPATLYERPASCFVADFLGEANLLAARVVAAEANGRIALAAGEHRLQALHDGPLAADAAVHLAIRPEQIAINPPAPLANALAGTVVGTLYAGDDTRVSIDVGNGVRVVARHRAELGPPPRPGSVVMIGWPEARAVVLTR